MRIQYLHGLEIFQKSNSDYSGRILNQKKGGYICQHFERENGEKLNSKRLSGYNKINYILNFKERKSDAERERERYKKNSINWR